MIRQMALYMQLNGGKQCFYPIGYEGKLLLQLMKRKCFTRKEFKLLEELGYTVTIEGDPNGYR